MPPITTTAHGPQPTAAPGTQPGALTLFVGALTRGGAGLVTAMLAAGGAPGCEAPEPDAPSEAVRDAARGHAVPLPDPQRWPAAHPLFALRPAMAIFVTRDLRDLAGSQLARRDTARPDVRLEAAPNVRSGRIADLLIAQSAALATLKRAGVPVWQLRFDRVLTEPADAAALLARQLRPWWRLDAAAMAAVVRMPLAADAATALAREYGL